MSQWLASLEKENFKLKSEARALKENLKLVKKYKRVREIIEEKKHRALSILTFESDNRNELDGREFTFSGIWNKENTHKHSKTKEKFSKEESLMNSYLKSPYLESFRCKASSSRQKSSEGPKPKVGDQSKETFENRPENERTLLDSLESYYEFEEENLKKTGKCGSSYACFKKTAGTGKARSSRNHSSKKISLNEELSLYKPHSFDMKNAIGYSKGSKSVTNKSNAHKTSASTNCKGCILLLSKGLSTRLCGLHKDN